MPENLGKQTSPIVVGDSDRASVRALLGQPWLTSDHWRFDLFRSTDRDSAIFVVAFIPVGRISQDVRGYVLVSYGEDDKVSGLGTGIARERNILGPQMHSNVTVRAAGLTYWESDDGDSRYLAADSTRAVDSLEQAPVTGRCRLMIATVSDRCVPVRLAADDDPPLTVLNDFCPPSVFPLSLVLLDVTPGTHQLRFFPSDTRAISYEADRELQCVAGERLYVKLTLTPESHKGTRWRKQKFSAEVAVERDDADWASRRGLIIYANGRWLVP